MEEEGVKEEPMKESVKEHAKEETVREEEITQQLPTEEGGLLCKLRELKKKVLSHLSCMS